MRIWTLDPKYLDAKGLVAVWRETLLAQKVLQGKTKGYKAHPQLKRFACQSDPVGAAATYLRCLLVEAKRRGYNFSEEKIASRSVSFRITTSKQQLLFEWEHLKNKLKRRDRQKYLESLAVKSPRAHPLFKIVRGQVEDWEKSDQRNGRSRSRIPPSAAT